MILVRDTILKLKRESECDSVFQVASRVGTRLDARQEDTLSHTLWSEEKLTVTPEAKD